MVVDLIGSGKCDVKQLITHRFPLEKAPEAFNLVRYGVDEMIIKVLIQCNA
jgi:threonine dehydrogenase-like Zn-dependent dehydrogenase